MLSSVTINHGLSLINDNFKSLTESMSWILRAHTISYPHSHYKDTDACMYGTLLQVGLFKLLHTEMQTLIHTHYSYVW